MLLEAMEAKCADVKSSCSLFICGADEIVRNLAEKEKIAARRASPSSKFVIDASLVSRISSVNRQNAVMFVKYISILEGRIVVSSELSKVRQAP